MKKHLPNALSCLNLFIGCLGIVMAFQDNLKYAGYTILVAASIDFLDGLSARLLKAYSDKGKQLDSLADIVSFGVLPAVIIYQLFLRSPQTSAISFYLSYSAFLITIFSALRLAKFNVDPRQSEKFLGLPTPANALVIASLPMIAADNVFLAGIIENCWFLFFFSIVMGSLLVLEIPFMSFKFRNWTVKDNLFRYILFVSVVVLISLFKFFSFPVILLVYTSLSLIQFKLDK